MTDQTAKENSSEKNMAELHMAWDFLEKELENFQKIVAEMEDGKRHELL